MFQKIILKYLPILQTSDIGHKKMNISPYRPIPASLETPELHRCIMWIPRKYMIILYKVTFPELKIFTYEHKLPH